MKYRKNDDAGAVAMCETSLGFQDSDAALDTSLNLVRAMAHFRLGHTDGGDGFGYDHADWADARVTGSRESLLVGIAPPEPAVILTPKPGPRPRINGARVFGVRPGSPFLFTIPATGERPMTFSARDLPAGLTLDAATGRITGKPTTPGRHKVLLTATNKQSKDSKPLEIVCGDQIALTPPMGWNSYNYLNANATEKIIRDVADAFVAKDLINHGWTYINTDFGWNTGEIVDPVTLALQPDPKKYPDFPGMCGYIHSLGLKVGLYSSPWTRGYSGFIGHKGLTPNEQCTHMSLWCLLASPLLLGFDVPNADEFTLSLLTNDEVIEVNQDPLGQQAKRLVFGGDIPLSVGQHTP